MKPHKFDSYRDKYESITLERTSDGILTISLHNPGQPGESLVYGGRPHDWRNPHVEWSHCFYDVARDSENEVVIVTGAGDDFMRSVVQPTTQNARLDPGASVSDPPRIAPGDWDRIMDDAQWVIMNLLNIPCPVIGAVNGAAVIHAELALLSDVVIASDTAVIQDYPHFWGAGYVPGDGTAVLWPELLGVNRGRYLLLQGQEISAAVALELGVVGEVVPPEQLLTRSSEVAREMLRRPRLVRRYARQVMTHQMKVKMVQHLGHGLALEGLAAAAGDKRPHS